MKNIITTCLLVLFTSASIEALAAPKQSDSDVNRAYWNPITIKNNTPYDIAYTMHSRSYLADMRYGIKKGATDTYHSGNGDKNATMIVAVCSWMTRNGGGCSKVEPLTISNCTGGVHYNAEQIKSIQINSLKSCEVTCLDGTKTSCVNDLAW